MSIERTWANVGGTADLGSAVFSAQQFLATEFGI
jgi:hypothetical protein